jgi:hypothetical protein
LALCLKKALPLAAAAFLFSGCLEMIQLAILPLELASDLSTIARNNNYDRSDAIGKDAGIFANTAQDRLPRRASTLSGGGPVDITPFLLHESSFQVVNGEPRISRLLIHYTRVNPYPNSTLYEYDMSITFEVNKQPCQLNAASAVTGDISKGQVKKNMQQYAASQMGVNLKDIKKYKVVFVTTRKSPAKFTFCFDNLFVQKPESCYYEFDFQVEYLKSRPFIGNVKPENYAVFDKVYRSDFTNYAAAAIDAQTQAWADARKLGVGNEAPCPVINVVKAVKRPR